MLRIVHYIGSVRFGGIEKVVLDLLKEQKNNSNLKVGIVIGQSKGEFKERFEELDIPILWAQLSSGYDLNPRKYIGIIKFFRNYDVVHCHCFNLFIAICCCISKIKICYTEHGNFGFGREAKKSDSVNRFLLRLFLKYSATMVTFNSHFTKEIARSRYLLRENAGKVIYNGVNFNFYRDTIEARQIQQQLFDYFVIGTSSRLAGVKRIDRLINAFAKFAQIADKVKLLIVGMGPKFNELHRIVMERKIQDHAIFAGFKMNVADYQELMNICVFPSQNETFGLVAIEALSLGKPVIVFKDGGGLAEIVKAVSPEDVVADGEALVNRMVFYYENRDVIEQEKKTRIKFAKLFSIQKMENELYQLYQEII